jgi:ATP-dependent RNA helicase DeaD
MREDRVDDVEEHDLPGIGRREREDGHGKRGNQERTAEQCGAGDEMLAISEKVYKHIDIAGIMLDEPISGIVVIGLCHLPVLGEVVEPDHSLVELPADLAPETWKALESTRISGKLIELSEDPGGPVRRSGGRFDKSARYGKPDAGDRPRKPRQKRKFD